MYGSHRHTAPQTRQTAGLRVMSRPCATRSICPTRGRFGRLLRVNQIWFTFSVLIQDSESVLIHFGGPRAYFAQSLRIGLIISSLPFRAVPLFCVTLLNTLSGEKKEPGGPYQIGKVLRALFSPPESVFKRVTQGNRKNQARMWVYDKRKTDKLCEIRTRTAEVNQNWFTIWVQNRKSESNLIHSQ